MSTRWHSAWLMGIAVIAAGCSLRTRFAQTANEPPVVAPDAAMSGSPPDASIDPQPAARVPDPPPPPRDASLPPGPPACAPELADRITVSQVSVDVDIRYKSGSYDGFPIDERIAFSVAGNGTAYVGWTDLSNNVRVTPLTSDFTRRGPDIQVAGWELGGLVALDDGFALLTRRRSPEPGLKPENGEPVADAFLVRYRDRSELFAVPLTGTSSITREAEPDARDCVPPHLYGRLAWNGVKFGAYFQVHGCRGDPHESFWADKLVYADARGRYVDGGWGWNCGTNVGLRMVAEPDSFTAVCIADSRPFPGLNLVTEGVPFRQLSPEYTVAGYAGAAFGSLVKVHADGGYAVIWLSRGVNTSQGRVAAAKPAYDVMLMRLDASHMPLGPKKLLLETPNSAESNLHLALYGSDRLLMVWDRIDSPRCPNDRTCWGPYGGTFARLMDLNGNALSSDSQLAQVPNTSDDLVVLPDSGDLAWAYVEEPERSYQNPLREDRIRTLPAKRMLSIARMQLCD